MSTGSISLLIENKVVKDTCKVSISFDDFFFTAVDKLVLPKINTIHQIMDCDCLHWKNSEM